MLSFGSGIALSRMSLKHVYVCDDYDLFQCFSLVVLRVMDVTLDYIIKLTGCVQICLFD